MRVLHITFSDSGGAGTAALRLHKGLLANGITSKLLVLEKRTDSASVFEYPKMNKYFILCLRVLKKLGLPLTLEHRNDNLYKSFEGNFEYFSFAKTSFVDLPNHPLVVEADVINLHWIPNFVDYATFFEKVGKPIVWTQHDMNAFQGGFHYKQDDLRNDHLAKYNNEQYQCKLKALAKVDSKNLTVVSPSKWMYNEAKNSQILGKFPHLHIPNGLDPAIFNYKDDAGFKQKLGLDNKKLTVLFISETVKSIRKGFNHIVDLVNDEFIASRCEFIAVGSIKNAEKVKGITYLGNISSEQQISEIYNAADVYLLPSKEDNLPNVMVESLASGTPVVAFNIGGIKDLVENGVTGYLSDDLTTAGLKKALENLMANYQLINRKEISDRIGAKYSMAAQAKAYTDVYMEAVNETILV